MNSPYELWDPNPDDICSCSRPANIVLQIQGGVMPLCLTCCLRFSQKLSNCVLHSLETQRLTEG